MIITIVHLSGVASKVPGWAERMLIPTLEAKIRAIVKEEVGQLEKVMDAKFAAVDVRFDGTNAGISARFDAVNARIDTVNTKVDSLEKRFPAV
jgi:hypothetical protein